MAQFGLFIQQMVNGLSIGGVYGLSAIGYALIYSVFGFSNFVHGEFTMVGAFVALFTASSLNAPFAVSVLAGMAGAAITAVLVERVAYSPLQNRRAPSLYFFVSAMGMSILLQNLGIVTLGATFRTFPLKLPIETIRFGNISVGAIDILTFFLSICGVFLLEAILKYTRTGRAIRAVAYDSYEASLMGINISRTSMAVFLLAGLLAGLSGVLRGVSYTIYPTMGSIVIKIWVCAILGGLGSVSGAFVGGILLGVIETLVSGYISSSYRDVFTFVLLIAVLLIRPAGLMGKTVEEKA